MNDTLYLFASVAVMALVTYFIRMLPLAVFRKKIKSKFVLDFLYYVPYVTLSVMTFPAIIEATQVPIAGACALILGMIAAWRGASLFKVSVGCCAVVFLVETFYYFF